MDSKKTKQLLHQFVTLRVLVGYLGEKKQKQWWDCGFLDATGRRFLETTFPRTAWAAAVRSTTDAARAVHDAAIGRIGSFHLFRLPADVENGVEAEIQSFDFKDTDSATSSVTAAMTALAGLTESLFQAREGPVQVGLERKILTPPSIAELAAHYHSGFHRGVRCFPYFSAGSNERR